MADILSLFARRPASKTQASTVDENLLQTIRAFAEAVEARDPYTAGHTWRVTRYAVQIAQTLNLSSETVTALAVGGVLHDIGKIGIRDDVLFKNGRLTDDEYTHIRTHPVIGSRITLPIAPLLGESRACIDGHHERWDGRGYPRGLHKTHIPPVARIMAVADAFDAMTSSRPYHKGITIDEGLAEVERHRESQFDPEAADALISAGRQGLLTSIWHSSEHGPLSCCVFCDAWVMDGHSSTVNETDCPLCQTRFELVERGGHLEVTSVLAAPNLAHHLDALSPEERAHTIEVMGERLANAGITVPAHLLPLAS